MFWKLTLRDKQDSDVFYCTLHSSSKHFPSYSCAIGAENATQLAHSETKSRKVRDIMEIWNSLLPAYAALMRVMGEGLAHFNRKPIWKESIKNSKRQLSANTKTQHSKLRKYSRHTSNKILIFHYALLKRLKKTTYIIWFTPRLQSSKDLQSKNQVHVSRQYFTLDINASKTVTHYSTMGFLFRKYHFIYPREKWTLRK